MNNLPASSNPPVPSIRIQNADDVSALFDGGEFLPSQMYDLCDLVHSYPCLPPEYALSNPFPPSELEDIPELSHLTTTSQTYLTGHGVSLPYSILQDNPPITSADAGLSPNLGSPVPSSTSSFGSSLSPSSFYEPLTLSDSESPASPSPATPDQQFFWPPHLLNHQGSDPVLYPAFIGAVQNDPAFSPGHHAPSRPRSKSSPSARCEPVASKAMLEANSRRRRHPAPFGCSDCGQTFTALFSLGRHNQSHSGERPYVCSIPGCEQRFYNNSDRKRHEKSKKRHKHLMTE